MHCSRDVYVFFYCQVDVILDNYMKHKKFRGVRNILEAEPDNWLSQDSVHRGLGTS